MKYQNGRLTFYNHAIGHYKYDTLYLGFIDADEFLTPAQGMDLSAQIMDLFEICENRISRLGLHCGGIGINHKIYGTSGHKTKPDGLVTEN